MADRQADAPISETDLTTFAVTLDAWARDLTPTEQVLLQRLLIRAGRTGDDAEGHVTVKGGLTSERGVIIVDNRPSPLLLNGLGLFTRPFEGGGGLGRR